MVVSSRNEYNGDPSPREEHVAVTATSQNAGRCFGSSSRRLPQTPAISQCIMPHFNIAMLRCILIYYIVHAYARVLHCVRSRFSVDVAPVRVARTRRKAIYTHRRLHKCISRDVAPTCIRCASVLRHDTVHVQCASGRTIRRKTCVSVRRP